MSGRPRPRRNPSSTPLTPSDEKRSQSDRRYPARRSGPANRVKQGIRGTIFGNLVGDGSSTSEHEVSSEERWDGAFPGLSGDEDCWVVSRGVLNQAKGS